MQEVIFCEIIRKDSRITEGEWNDPGRTCIKMQCEQAVNLQVGGGYRIAGNRKTVAIGRAVSCFYGCAVEDGKMRGKAEYPIKDNVRLTNTCALVIWEFPEGLEIIGE